MRKLQRWSPPSVLRPVVLIFKFDIIIYYLIFILLIPCKRTQHCWPTTPNIVGCYMSRLFALTVACCCAKFETVQTFSYVQTDAATPKIVGPTMLGNCCVRLHVASRVYNEATLGTGHYLSPDFGGRRIWG